jgi:hypothetical protein
MALKKMHHQLFFLKAEALVGWGQDVLLMHVVVFSVL